MISRSFVLAALFSCTAALAAAEEPPGAPLEEPIPPAADVAPDEDDAREATFPDAPSDGAGAVVGDDDPGEGPPPISDSNDARQEESEYGGSGG